MYKNVSYGNMPVKRPAAGAALRDAHTDNTRLQKKEEKPAKKPDCDCGILDNLETDDIILLIVAAVLLAEGCDDKLLLGVLAFVFLSDRI